MRVLGLLVANAAVLLGSHALLRRVSTGEAATDAILFVLLRLLLISVAVLALGAARMLDPLVLGLAGALTLGGLMLCGEHRRLPRPRLPEVGNLALAAAALLAARSLVQVWLFAPFQRDALTYHLPKIGEWIQHGGFTGEWGLDLRSTFPSGFELIETWWIVFLHHDVLIEMAGLEFLLLAFLSVYGLARRVGASPRSSFLGGLLYALAPGVCLQATSCLNDGPTAALWTATAALIVARAPWTLTLIPAAVGIGVKPTYAYAAPGLVLLAWWWRPRAASRATWVVAGLALAAGSSWYVRNAVVYGNPIHPMGASGISVQDGYVAQRFGPSLRGLLENLSRVVETRIDDHLGPYDPELPYISGWGIGGFAVGLVAVLLAARSDRAIRRLALGFGLSLLCVLFLVVFDPWFLRYVLFFPAVLAVASAKVGDEIPEISLVAWAAILVQFAGSCVPGRFPFEGVRDMAALSWRQRTFYPHPDLDAVGAVGFLEHPGDEVKIYPLYRPDFSRRVVPIRAASPEEMMAVLSREGLEYLYCPKGHEFVDRCVERKLLKRRGAGLLQVTRAELR